jgi:hypothetical protein
VLLALTGEDWLSTSKRPGGGYTNMDENHSQIVPTEMNSCEGRLFSFSGQLTGDAWLL